MAFGRPGGMPNGFKGRHFSADFILLRALVPEVQRQLLSPGGDDAGARLRLPSHDHLSLDPDVRPRLEKLIRWYRGHTGCSWRVDKRI